MLSLVNATPGAHRTDHDMTSTQGVLPASRRNVGPYRLCIELASGGMASVYLARPRHCGSRPAMVAVKITGESRSGMT